VRSAVSLFRDIAERRVASHLRQLGIDDEIAPAIVAIVFDTITEPDKRMQDAGVRELSLAVIPTTTPQYLRNLAVATWRSMLAEARS
jgi:hypothetical protein